MAFTIERWVHNTAVCIWAAGLSAGYFDAADMNAPASGEEVMSSDGILGCGHVTVMTDEGPVQREECSPSRP
jgi:hypothetical protein